MSSSLLCPSLQVWAARWPLDRDEMITVVSWIGQAHARNGKKKTSEVYRYAVSVTKPDPILCYTRTPFTKKEGGWGGGKKRKKKKTLIARLILLGREFMRTRKELYNSTIVSLTRKTHLFEEEKNRSIRVTAGTSDRLLNMFPVSIDSQITQYELG